ncbi:hypothetical protein GCM10023319_58520 [Nocardia iowensis]
MVACVNNGTVAYSHKLASLMWQSVAVLDLRRLRRRVFAAPGSLASERPRLATSSRALRPLGRETGRERRS